MLNKIFAPKWILFNCYLALWLCYYIIDVTFMLAIKYNFLFLLVYWSLPGREWEKYLLLFLAVVYPFL